MPQDIKVLFLLLIIILIMVVLMQNNNQCDQPVIKRKDRRESFAVNNELNDDIIQTDMESFEEEPPRTLKNIRNKINQELDELIVNNDDLISQESFENPIDNNINQLRNNTSSSKVDNQVLEELIREVNTGNDLRVNSTENKIFQDRSRSINSAKNYRKVSYADSE